MNLNKHLEFFDPDKIKANKLNINIIGVGAVGSYIALQLAKLGVSEIAVWDFDTVDDHNIANQVYTLNDLNKAKVDAIEEHLKESNPDIIVHKKGRWNPGDIVSGIVFLEVDSMAVRQAFCEDNEYNNGLKLVIDARIGLESGEIHCCNWTDYDQVQNYINKVNSFDDSEASVTVSACGTTLSVSPSVYLAAAMAVSCLINYINNKELKTYIAYDAFGYLMKGVNI